MSREWFFTADCHLGHPNIIKYSKRPFLSQEELKICDLINKGSIPPNEFRVPEKSVELMNETIINNINNIVEKNDNLVIIGDFCKGTEKKNEKYFRNQINCKNIYLVLGNHDDRKSCEEVFTACYENYLFNINGQKIFTSHYPSRSWNQAAKGSWMLYGHVHGSLTDQDQGKLSKYDEYILREAFANILNNRKINKKGVIEELIQSVSSIHGWQLTLDVGVDNPLRTKLPFGTPWSMSDIRDYMENKIHLWNARKTAQNLI